MNTNTNINADHIATIAKWLGTGSINVFGMPFSGKDTQCGRLAELLDAVTFGGGDILRNSKTSEQLQTEINGGKLAPTTEYLSLILPYFQRDEFQGKPLVLSSIGRWAGEEQTVIPAATEADHPIKAAIFLDMPHDEAQARLDVAARDRVDDSADILQTRFNEFDTKTQPVLAVYESQNLLITINAVQTPDEVTAAIIEALYLKSQEA